MKFRILIILLSVLFLTVSCTKEVKEVKKTKPYSDEIFQYSTSAGFAAKKWDGSITYAQVQNLGDFGLGTFNGLDGEMILLEGKFHKIRLNGEAEEVKRDEKTPFVTVKFFKADQNFELDKELSMEEMNDWIFSRLENPEAMAAVKIEARFKYIKTRSIEKQAKPYPEIEEVIRNQQITERENSEGTLAGFWMPETFDKVNFTGFHFHYLTKDKSSGGHVLDFIFDKGKVYIDNSNQLKIQL